MASGSIKSYVLRSGRMSDAQKRSYENLSSVYCIPIHIRPDFESDSKLSPNQSYESIFGNSNPVIIEIGFGSGAATAAIAKDNP